METKDPKKDLRRKLEESLINVLSEVRGNISPKKLRRNSKKASKALLAGLKVTGAKKQQSDTSAVNQKEMSVNTVPLN